MSNSIQILLLLTLDSASPIPTNIETMIMNHIDIRSRKSFIVFLTSGVIGSIISYIMGFVLADYFNTLITHIVKLLKLDIEYYSVENMKHYSQWTIMKIITLKSILPGVPTGLINTIAGITSLDIDKFLIVVITSRIIRFIYIGIIVSIIPSFLFTRIAQYAVAILISRIAIYIS